MSKVKGKTRRSSRWVCLHGRVADNDDWTVAYLYDDGTFAVIGNSEYLEEKDFPEIKWGAFLSPPIEPRVDRLDPISHSGS